MSNVKMITVRFPGGAVPNYDQLFVGGVDIIDLLSKAMVGATAGAPTGTTDVMVSQELYIATQAGVGYALGDALRRVELTVASANTTTVGWYNITRSLSIATNVLGTAIRPAGESGAGITDAELRAKPLEVDLKGSSGNALGAVDSAIAAEDGSGTITLVGGLKRVISHLFSVVQRIPTIGQKSTANSIPVALSTEHGLMLDSLTKGVTALHDRFLETVGGATQQKMLMVNVANAADIGGGSGGVAISPTKVEDFTAVAAVGTDAAIGDALRKITIYNTTALPLSTSVFWYNITKKKYIAEPSEASYKTPSQNLEQKIGFRVIKVAAGSVLSVEAIETTLGGAVFGVVAFQESGAGQILGDDDVAWDLPSGGSFELSQTQTAGTYAVRLDKTTKFKSVSGVLRLGVNFQKALVS